MDLLENGKTEANAQRFLGYILTAAICTFCLIYIDQTFGLTLLAALVFAPVGSFYCLKKARLTAAVELSQEYVCKGETVEITITISNIGFLPAPFILIELGNESVVVSSSRKGPGQHTELYTASVWGTALVGADLIVLHDFLGLFKTTYAPLKKRVSVFPAINESQKNDLVKYIRNEQMCDEDEGSRSDMPTFQEQPGYEFTPYAPGDPLNRISWRMLAKHDKLMVRRNEHIKNKDIRIQLDRRGRDRLSEERIVEAVLSMLTSLVREGIPCKVQYFSENKWKTEQIENADGVLALQSSFLHYSFSYDAFDTRLPPHISGTDDMTAIFTCSPDAVLLDLGCILVCPEELSQLEASHGDNCWMVNYAYDFTAI